MANDPILGFPQVAPNQSQKETTMNDATSWITAATQDSISFDLNAADATVTADQFTKHFLLIGHNHVVARTLNVPATKRVFAVDNEGYANLTVQVIAGQSKVLISGASALFVSDGVRLRKIG